MMCLNKNITYIAYWLPKITAHKKTDIFSCLRSESRKKVQTIHSMTSSVGRNRAALTFQSELSQRADLLSMYALASAKPMACESWIDSFRMRSMNNKKR